MDAVTLREVSKKYGRHLAVDQLSLTVPEGSIYGFIGPNGSGKTTTIRMILHIIHPDQGTIEVLGKKESRAANDAIGYLPEERGLYKKMTVSRILKYYASIKGMSGSEANRAMDSWLTRMELEDWKNKKVEALSKGMAQKIQFIASVITGPRLLILDEPFSGLDPVNLETIRNVILDLRKQGTTVILSTHDMSTAQEMCDFIFMIYKGKKVLDGNLDSIQKQYGADTIRIRTADTGQSLETITGVDNVRDYGHYQEVRYAGTSQKLLQHLVEKTEVRLFEVTRPSLHDIFVRIAGEDETES
ncbi:MAG TPA: ATP-binding cassette domain-containing protein [Verrucomicrobiales bacterium]|nr:ATP-binding cassette domain-containing protein [Verrucomicrobiales bacterium]HIL68579.1 ATP-binding cassette domain-containing protein [Verrucomicrobiota bacterium]